MDSLNPALPGRLLVLITACLSLGALLIGYSRPLLALTIMGRQELYSLPAGIKVLVQNGHVLLGLTVLIFSVVMPLLKLFIIIVLPAMAPSSFSKRQAMLHHQILPFLSKLSMVEIFVAAVLVAMLKLDLLVKAQSRSGLYWLLASIALAIIAGFGLEHLPPIPRKYKAPGEGTKYMQTHGAKGLLIVGLLLLTAGSLLMLNTREKKITSVKLTQRAGLIPPIEEMIDVPDYYLMLLTTSGRLIKTNVYRNRPIGNGLWWDLPPTLLKKLVEITIWDQDPLNDDALDRINVEGLVNNGRYYTIGFEAKFTLPTKAAVGTTAAGVFVLIGGGICFLHRSRKTGPFER